MADEKVEAVPDEIQIKLNFRVPPRMPSVYAHHLLIQPGEHEVTLSFFEIIPPPLMPGQERAERLEYIQETGIIAECVARITIANARFPGFAAAMHQISEQMNALERQDADIVQDNSEG